MTVEELAKRKRGRPAKTAEERAEDSVALHGSADDGNRKGRRAMSDRERIDAFWAKVEKPAIEKGVYKVQRVSPGATPVKVELTKDACWLFLPAKEGHYGNFRVGKRQIKAHEFAWETETGRSVPDGYELHHICENPRCVRPTHLTPVTKPVNLLLRQQVGNRMGRQQNTPQTPTDELSTKGLLSTNGFRRRKSDGVVVDFQGRPVDLWFLLTPEGHQKLWEKNHPNARKAVEYSAEEIERGRYHDPARRFVKHDLGDEYEVHCEFTGCANPIYRMRVFALGANGQAHWKEVDEFLGGEFSPHSHNPHYAAFDDCLQVGVGLAGGDGWPKLEPREQSQPHAQNGLGSTLSQTQAQQGNQKIGFAERAIRRIIPEHYRMLERLAMTKAESEAVERYDEDYRLHQVPKVKAELAEEGKGVNREV